MSLPLLLAALLAPSAESPGAFAARLYDSYRDENYSPFRNPRRIFAPPFVAALAEDSRLSRDEVGFIDADPLCQCQDHSGMRAELGKARPLSARQAEVPVRLRFGAEDVRDIRLKLVRTGSGWRVADIVAEDSPSFLRDLRAWNRRKRSELGR
ncbi:MAG TPA: DUF3828 domain-containing protein [Allosphingosinicella sp.]|jgi:hypothetical protein